MTDQHRTINEKLTSKLVQRLSNYSSSLPASPVTDEHRMAIDTAIAKLTQLLSIKPLTLSDLLHDGYVDPAAHLDVQYLTGSALKTGVHLMGGPGSGKSLWLGHVPAWGALLEHQPLVIIDPLGAIIDTLFYKIMGLPWEVQYPLWQRIRYIDAGSQEYIVPTPLYDPQSTSDTPYEIANRLPGIFERQDTDLRSAPILGRNALKECAIHAGLITIALGRQLDFVIDLLAHPGTYKGELREALARNPDLEPSVTYFRQMMDPTSAKLREKRTGSFQNKLLPFLADPTMLASFSGTKKRLNWETAIQKRKAVVIDLRHERDPDRRQFKMSWYVKTFMDTIKSRGMAGRGQEVMLIIDEITDMLGQRTKEGNSILAEDMEELITRLGRNFGVNVIVAHQNLSQLDERIQNVFMQMGTQLIGRLSNPNDAVRVARQFLRYDPYKLKKFERVWHSVTEPPLIAWFNNSYGPVPKVVDIKTHEFTPDEQLLMLVNKLQSLGRFRFMTQVALGEGDRHSSLKTISIERLAQYGYPNEDLLLHLRRQLAQRDGVPVKTVLAEIRAHRTRETSPKPNKPMQTAKKSVTVNDNSTKSYDLPPDRIPGTPEPTPSISAVLPAETLEGADGDVFQ